mgnify:FL=1
MQIRSSKMKNLHIKCGNIKQRQDVIDVLESNGFELIGANSGPLDIQTGDNVFAVTSHSPETQDESLWFEDFMQKYAHGVLSGNGTNGTDIAENAEIRNPVANHVVFNAIVGSIVGVFIFLITFGWVL